MSLVLARAAARLGRYVFDGLPLLLLGVIVGFGAGTWLVAVAVVETVAARS